MSKFGWVPFGDHRGQRSRKERKSEQIIITFHAYTSTTVNLSTNWPALTRISASIIYHPRSGVYNSFGCVCQCLSVICMYVGHFCTCSVPPRSTDRVHIWRSSGQGQASRSQERKKVKENSYRWNVNYFRLAKTPVWSNIERDVCMQYGVIGYGGSKGVTAIFVTWLEVTTRN